MMRLVLAVLMSSAAWAQTGEITGLVTSAGGRPLASVEVGLMPADGSGGPLSRSSRFTRTGLDGRFRFGGVEFGSHTLAFHKEGHEGGARPRRAVTLAETEPNARLTVELRRSGALSGRVLDPDGDPLPGARVRAVVWRTVQGRREWSQVRTAQTDDRGEYRLYGLSPGRYVLDAQPPPLPAPAGVAALEFSPARRPAPAALDWGREIDGLDFTLAFSPNTAIEGGALQFDGSPCERCSVTAAPDDAGLETLVRTNEDGLFAFRGLPPGDYVLASRSREWRDALGFERVALGEGAPREVVLRADPALSVAGRVVGLDPPESPSQPPRVRLSATAVLAHLRRAEAAVDPVSGEFEIEAVAPGDYVVQLIGAPPGTYLETARLGGRPLPSGTLTVSDGLSIQGLELRLADDAGTVSGVVASSADEAAPAGGVVFLLPAEYGENGRFETTTRIGADRSFAFRGAPPGSYWLFATRATTLLDIGSPEDLERIRAEARKIRLAPNQELSAEAPYLGDR